MMLEDDGFRVVVSDSCQRGELDAALRPSDVTIVDLGPPDRDGICLIKTIRTWSPVPILALPARTAEVQRLAAFEAGADDYILKPSSASELLARVRAVLRRHARGELPTGVLEFDNLSIDLGRRIVMQRDGRELRLTPLEHGILETLARERDRVVTRAKIMNEVWGPNLVNPRVLRVFITGLRKKLEINPSRPTRIITGGSAIAWWWIQRRQYRKSRREPVEYAHLSTVGALPSSRCSPVLQAIQQRALHYMCASAIG